MSETETRGFCAAGFEPVRAAFAENFAQGLENGAAFAVTIEGETVVYLQGGWQDKAKTKLWDARTIVPVFSTTKPIAALMIARLVDQVQGGAQVVRVAGGAGPGARLQQQVFGVPASRPGLRLATPALGLEEFQREGIEHARGQHTTHTPGFSPRHADGVGPEHAAGAGIGQAHHSLDTIRHVFDAGLHRVAQAQAAGQGAQIRGVAPLGAHGLAVDHVAGLHPGQTGGDLISQGVGQRPGIGQAGFGKGQHHHGKASRGIGTDLHGQRELVAASRHGGNRVGADHTAQLRHLHMQIGLFYHQAAPDAIDQFVLAEQLPRMLQQRQQQFEGAPPEPDLSPVTQQAPLADPQLEAVKAVVPVGAGDVHALSPCPGRAL